MLAKAAEETAKYEWMKAAQLYQSALDRIEPLETARVTELLARCYFKAAFQSETREEFKQRMQLAEAAHEKVVALYQRAGLEGLSRRAKARELFSTFWAEDDAKERRNIIAKAISLGEESAQLLGDQRNRRELAETYRDLLTFLFEALGLSEELMARQERFERALEIGEKAMSEFGVLRDEEGLLDCLDMTLLIITTSEGTIGSARYRDLLKREEAFARQMAEISGKTGTPHTICLTNRAASIVAFDHEGDYVKALRLAEAGISAAEKTRDSYLTGFLGFGAMISAYYAGSREEEGEQRRRLFEKVIELAPSCVENLEVPLSGGWLDSAYGFWTESYTSIANYTETEADSKRKYLRKAIEIGRRGIIYEDYSPGSNVNHAISKALYFLATLEENIEDKKQFLGEALVLREKQNRASEKLLIPRSWDRGVNHNYLALVKAELSNLEVDPEKKVRLLQAAVSDMRECVELCSEWAAMFQYHTEALAQYEEWYGDILLRLHQLTGDPETVRQAVRVNEDSIAIRTKLGHTSSIGAVRWKIAKLQDILGDYKEASRVFRRAAEDYKLGAKKLRASEQMFASLASYMDAWSLIEEARLHHSEEQYLLAAEDYTKAASTLQPTRTWGQLSKHYTACSFLEGGEALSRQERPDAALESFSEAVKTFRSAKSEIDNRLRENLGSQEKEELNTWRKVTDGRERLCQGRILLEEAKILDRKGEEEASAAKYGSAFEAFRGLMAEAEAEQSRRELETLSLFCQAWAKMKEAETRASPDLYAEAAESFTKVEKVATRKRSHLVALANASICRSLEAGTQFRRTRNTQLYSEIKKELETATDYYQEAGLQNAADWTRATGKLFDALVYLADAATERESKKKTELFHLAEKHLQLAAKLYEQAGFPVKKNEALKHLERAREEKELLLTPVEALAENPALTGVTATPVSLIRDQALGLERFDAANVVGNLSLHQKELGVGSDLTLELEMANVGKTAATLIKLENIAPDGFELDRERIQYRIEDNYIDMKGKRLEYLKTHEVKIPMKALRKGAFELRPRILFVDEKGTYRSYEFEPAAVTVRELGISGWLKGPSK